MSIFLQFISNSSIFVIESISFVRCCCCCCKSHRFKSIVCDVNWTSTKWFVTMNEQNCVSVWDLETEKICRGHKAHMGNHGGGSVVQRQYESDAPLGGAMCITKNRQILSIDRHAFVRYCLASNTYSAFPDNFIKKRGNVSQLTTSPYNPDIVAVGYRSGLILLANYAGEFFFVVFSS